MDGWMDGLMDEYPRQLMMIRMVKNTSLQKTATLFNVFY